MGCGGVAQCAVMFWTVLFIRHIDGFSSPALNLDKGFNILETASKLLPQGLLVRTARETLNFAWRRMMAELAPQDKEGGYRRPSYCFQEPTVLANEPGRYHVYVGNPCPWCHRVKITLALRNIKANEISVTELVDDPVRASRGGWVFDSSTKEHSDPLGSFDLVSAQEVAAE